MIRCFAGVVLCFVVSFVLAGEPAKDSWVGQKILARQAGSNLQVQGKAAPVKHIVYTCVADENGHLRMNYPGQEGTAPKAEWVRLVEAHGYFSDRVARNPDDAFAWSRRGVAHRYAGKPDLALADLKEAVRLAPTNADLVGIRGMMWWANKDLDRAIADYSEAVRLDPTYAVGFRNRAMAWNAKGEVKKALADYAEAAKAAPHYAPTFHERAAVWRARGEYRKALDDLVEANRLDDRYAAALADQARLLASCPDDSLRDGKRAVQLAEKAHKLSGGKSGPTLDALAIAYAEAGDFPRAVEYETLALADAAFEKDHGKQVRERITQFQHKKPWRE